MKNSQENTLQSRNNLKISPKLSILYTDGPQDLMSSLSSNSKIKLTDRSRTLFSSINESNANNLSKSYNFLPFDEYKNEMNRLMNPYRKDELKDKSPNRNSSEKNITISDTLSNSLIKVFIEKGEYKSPGEAKQKIIKNKRIFNEINEKIYQRQKFLYLESINNIEEEPPLHKVKITNTYPKIMETIQGKSDFSKISDVSLSIFSNGIADMYGYYIYCSKYLPECREQFSICGDSSNFYIFGGCSTKLYNDLWHFNSSNSLFNKLNSDNLAPDPRFGHTAIFYNKKIYFLGGKIKLNNNFSYMAEIDIFNLEDKHWTTPLIVSKNYLKLRRNHISELIGNQVFVHGGFDEENNILSDCKLLTLSPNIKWSKVSISNKTTPPPLAGHTSCLIIGSESNSKFNIYNSNEKGVKYKGKKTKEKGIYIFGGKTDKNQFSNDIWIVKVGIKPLEWIKAETQGIPPSPRYLHSMNFFEERNFIIIYGGKNELNNETNVFNDIFLFEISRYEWIEIKVFSDSPIRIYRRYGHIGFIYGQKLLILGGVNNENYVGSSLFIINLDCCYNYSTKNVNIKDNEKFKLLYINEKKSKKKYKNENKNEFFLNSNLYLPPIK